MVNTSFYQNVLTPVVDDSTITFVWGSWLAVLDSNGTPVGTRVLMVLVFIPS